MIYTKKQIEQYAEESGFIKNNIEKVVRLIDVLHFLFLESSFKDKLVLKGGTAINLIYTNLKRLSLDIDLDYCGSLDREEVLKDRELLEDELDRFMIREQYQISEKSKNSFALSSRKYRYQNAFGSNDIIKLDINYMDRIHIYDVSTHNVNFFDHQTIIKAPSKEELFGMKLSALLDRSKPRDLYDATYLVNNIDKFDKTALKKATIFYSSLGEGLNLKNSSFDKIKSISYRNIKTGLLPILNKKEKFDYSNSILMVNKMLENLLVLNKNEKEYLNNMSKGNYDPHLLFDEKEAIRAEKHPMAKWRVHIINKNN